MLIKKAKRCSKKQKKNKKNIGLDTYYLLNPSVCPKYIAFIGFIAAHHTLITYHVPFSRDSFFLNCTMHFLSSWASHQFSREVSQLADSNSIVIC